MKKVRTLVNPAVNALRRGDYTDADRQSINQTAAQHVNEIFKQLMAAKTAWRVAYPDDQSLADGKKTMVKALIDAGVSDFEMIKLGVSKARLDPSDFFPSPGRFIQWCQPTPEDLGLPTDEAAYREAAVNSYSPIAHRWSHPAVYQAGKETGWFFLKTASQRDTQAEFKKVYADICRRVMSGDVFAVPAPDSTRLEQHTRGGKVNTEESKRAGKSAIASMKSMFRSSTE